MSTDHPLSQATFDQMLDFINRIKSHSRVKKDDQLWAMADNLDALLHRFATDLMVDGVIPFAK